MSKWNYWDECIECSLNEHGVTATEEQIQKISGDVEVAHENYGMAHGYDVRQSPVETDKDRRIKSLEAQVAALESDLAIFRGSVAERRRVEPNDVYLDRYGGFGRGAVMIRG